MLYVTTCDWWLEVVCLLLGWKSDINSHDRLEMEPAASSMWELHCTYRARRLMDAGAVVHCLGVRKHEGGDYLQVFKITQEDVKVFHCPALVSKQYMDFTLILKKKWAT